MALLCQASFFALLNERCITAGIGECAVTFEVEHVIHDVREKCAVVTDEQNRLVSLLQIFLEPRSGIEVEVVGRLVQQQHVGRAHKLARDAEAPSLPATEMRKRPRPRFYRVEPKSMKDRVDSGRESVAAFAVEALEIPVVTGEHLCG